MWFVIVVNQHQGQGIKWKTGNAVPGKGTEIIGGDPYRKSKDDGKDKEELDVGAPGNGRPYFADAQHKQ